jgi:hypothetical protein
MGSDDVKERDKSNDDGEASKAREDAGTCRDGVVELEDYEEEDDEVDREVDEGEEAFDMLVGVKFVEVVCCGDEGVPRKERAAAKEVVGEIG